jgi:hypothetical protein
MKYFLLVAVAFLSTIAPCWSGTPGGLFRDAYGCPERGLSSVCIYGTIPKGSRVTVLAKGWKSSAQPKETFSNEKEDFQNGVKTSTRLQVETPPPKDAAMIAVLAATPTVNELQLEEVQDPAIAERIAHYIKHANDLNLDPDIRVLKMRLLKVSPTILLSETFLASPDEVAAVEKELATGCLGCENVPLLVGQNLEDIFKPVRSTKVDAVEHTCGGISLAFALSGRPHILSHASACESDSFSATLVHDLSGTKPRLVFKLEGGF